MPVLESGCKLRAFVLPAFLSLFVFLHKKQQPNIVTGEREFKRKCLLLLQQRLAAAFSTHTQMINS
jgi:hypothetical protein